jgi:hypothetical protein
MADQAPWRAVVRTTAPKYFEYSLPKEAAAYTTVILSGKKGHWRDNTAIDHDLFLA